MASYDPPYINSNIFNDSYFIDLDGNLSLAAADLRYLKLSGGVVYGLTTFSNSLNVIGNLSINGDVVDLSLISGVIAGTPQNSKALSLDSTGKINGNLTLTGTLSSLVCSATTLTVNGVDVGSNIAPLVGITLGTPQNSKVLTLDSSGNINGGLTLTGTVSAQNLYASNLIRTTRTTSGQSFSSINGTSTCALYHFNNGDAYFGTTTANNLVFQTNNTGRLTINGSTGDITGISALTATTLNASTINSTNKFSVSRTTNGRSFESINGTSTCVLNHSNNGDAFFGTATSNNLIFQTNDTPRLTINGSTGDITGISALTATTLNGTIGTAAQPNIKSLGTLTSLNTIGLINTTFLNNTTSFVNYQTWVNNLVTPMTTALIMSNVGSTIGTTSAHPFRIMTNNSNKLFIDVNGNVSISTSAPSGTYKLETTSANFTGLYLNGSLITSSATELNYLAGITPGTASANKALVVDSSINISGINSLTTTSGLNVSNATTPLSLRNISNARGLDITIQSTGTYNTDIRLINDQATALLGLYANGKRQITLINNNDYVNIVQHNAATTGLQLGGVLVTSSAAELNYLSGLSAGVVSASKALLVDSNKDLYGLRNTGITTLDPTNNSSLLYKGVFRKNSQSLGDGCEIYDTQFHSTPNPCLNILAANSTSPIYTNFYNYNYGNFRIYHNNASGALGEGMTFKYLRNVGVSALNSNSINFRGSDDSLQFIINEYNSSKPNTIFHPQSWVNDCQPNYTNFSLLCCKGVLMKDCLMLSSSTSASLDPSSQCCITGSSTYTDGSYNKVLRLLGQNASPVEFQIQCNSGTSGTPANAVWMGVITNNDLRFGNNNQTKMIVDTNGRLGVGTTSPSCGLDIATGENSVTTTINIAINTYSYNVSTNAWTNLGGGPVSVNMCSRFRGSIWVQDKIYATSDRRLKSDIKPLDITLEHYSKLNPVSYKWKNTDKVMLGLIAQEVKDVCGESITAIENENMKKETDDDPEGYQLTVDYNCINMMNVVAIKKLIEKVNQLEEALSKLQKK